MRQWWFAPVLVVMTGSTIAGAEPQRADKAAAEALFSEGRKLMTEGRYAEACPKFEASQRIDPGIGTMLNLAECYESIGRTASAWAEFREVISAARAAESKDRERLALQRAQALEAKLSRLVITLDTANTAVTGLEVRRDGAKVDPAELGSAIPIDPGKHVIEATAPGKQKWLKSVEVDGNGAQVSIAIPPLADAPDAAAPATRRSPDATQNVAVSSSSSNSKVLPIALGAAGVVGLGVGTFFGLQAMSKWSDAKDECVAYPYECSKAGLASEDDARQAATISTVGFITGAVLAGTGAVLWFSSGSKDSTTTTVGIAPGYAVVKGSF